MGQHANLYYFQSGGQYGGYDWSSVNRPLPAGLTVADGSTPATCGAGTLTDDGRDRRNRPFGGTVPTTGCVFTVTVTGATAGAYTNTVSNAGAIISVNGGLGVASNTVNLTVVSPPTISKVFTASSIPLNGTTTLTFTITNGAGNTAAETGVAFSDTLTNGLQVAATPNIVNTCAGTPTAAAGTTSISLTGGTIAAPGGTTCTLSVDVTGTAAGTVSNTTGAVSSTNGGTGAVSNTATLTVMAPPTISKAFTASSVALNGTTTLTFTITNGAGNTAAETGVAFSDTLTNGLKVAATPNIVNNCGGTPTAAAGQPPSA